ncbi:SOS response-associated peptidase [Bordetella sp. FB-8]|uniref:SOS response-associated peptidase n=1 Tax=Bordetella sp. FB-8 TaxID=1159870 RepID=UPI0003AA18FB|nr:SOS response-associated peptidase family protein [Bordetella sp. FB-8]
MCSHYESVKIPARLKQYFGAAFETPAFSADLWPKRQGLFVRRPPELNAGDDAVPDREAVLGRWGLISARTSADGMAKAEKLSTFNARSETASRSFTFGNAWQRAQHCIMPAEAVFEPDWRSGRAVPTRFSHVDGVPLGIAGLWDKFRDTAGQWHESYTMLTINADQHPLFREYHRTGEEKRMVVILPAGAYGEWLAAGADDTRDFLHPFPADQLLAQAVIPAAGSSFLF